MAKATTGKAKPAAKKANAKKTGGKGSRKPAGSPAQTTNAAGHNGDRASDDAIRSNFIAHKGIWNRCQEAVKAADKALRDMVAAAKADGFLKKEFEIADALSGKSAKKEARVVADVETRLRVARWVGHKMADQYDLFAGSVQVRSTDEAYEAGKQACMEGDPKKPPPQFTVQELSQRWMAGYQDEEERRVKDGIKQLDPKPGNGEEAWAAPGDPEGSRPAAGWGDTRQPQAVN